MESKILQKDENRTDDIIDLLKIILTMDPPIQFMRTDPCSWRFGENSKHIAMIIEYENGDRVTVERKKPSKMTKEEKKANEKK